MWTTDTTNVTPSSHSGVSTSRRMTSSVSRSVAPMRCCVVMLPSMSCSSCHVPIAVGEKRSCSGTCVRLPFSACIRSRVGRTGFAAMSGA